MRAFLLTAGYAAALFAVAAAGPAAPAASAPSAASAAPAASAASAAPAVPGSAGPAVLACRLADPRLDEASGIAVGRRSPGVLYVQNDSGDTNRFFALDPRTCVTLARVTVTGARNVDWEDIAAAPDAQGTPSVWLADIGDNRAVRTEIDVYRVDEPRVAPTDRDATLRTAPADVWRLRYPSGPANAESLAVTPQGTGYLVTKSYLGQSAVYRLPARPDPERVQTLRRVAALTFLPTRATDPGGRPELGPAGQMAASGASIDPDGTVLAIRTYTDVYLYPLRDRGRYLGVVTALHTTPTRVALPRQPQGEGIALSGGTMWLDSESVHSGVYRLPYTAPVAATTATAGSPTATGPRPSASAGPTSGSGRTGSGPSSGSPASGSTSPAKYGSGGGSWIPGLVIFGLVIAGAIGWWVLQLRGRPAR